MSNNLKFTKPKIRPLSPHLQIYKPQITSILSIIHRATGMMLSVGMIFLLYWLWAVSNGIESYNTSLIFFHSWFGQTVLWSCLFGFYYHLFNGIRHLFWDMGYGFSIKTTTLTGWVVIILSTLLTFLTWVTTSIYICESIK